MKQKKSPHVIVFRIAALLLISILATTSIVSGRYARYTNAATGGGDMQVAYFQVTETGELRTTTSVSLSPKETVKLGIQVHNASEVAVEYCVRAVNRYGNLPLEFKVLDENGNEVEVSDLNCGDTRNLVLQIHWRNGENSDSYIGMVDIIDIFLTAVQVD